MKIYRVFSHHRKSLLLLLFYIVLSLGLMSFSNTDSLRGVRWGMLKLVEVIDSVTMRFTIRQNLEKQNEYLTQENFYLHMNNQKLREVLLENMRLKKLLALKDSSEKNFVMARVIGTGTETGIGSIVLNVGESDGVGKNMAVVNADGLVGKIIVTTSGQSIVQMLKDLNCFVSARLQNSREIGTVSWSGGPQLNLDNIPKNIPVEEGELVITSGLSQIYPADLKIGVVTEIAEGETDLFKRIRLKPAVQFNAVEEVFVIRAETSETPAIE